MQLDIDKEVALLHRMTVGQLREKYQETWGEPTNTRNKQWLVKRIAWKMQANMEGDISERAKRRAAKLARGTDIRTTAPKAIKPVPKLMGDTVTGFVQPEEDNRLPYGTDCHPLLAVFSERLSKSSDCSHRMWWSRRYDFCDRWRHRWSRGW